VGVQAAGSTHNPAAEVRKYLRSPPPSNLNQPGGRATNLWKKGLKPRMLNTELFNY